MAIKNAYMQYENKLDDELSEHFVNKKIPEFWKVWHAKFRRRIYSKLYIEGYGDDAEIANLFANHF
jgi:hypothetical protein